jgi:hypothetical protein
MWNNENAKDDRAAAWLREQIARAKREANLTTQPGLDRSGMREHLARALANNLDFARRMRDSTFHQRWLAERNTQDPLKFDQMLDPRWMSDTEWREVLAGVRDEVEDHGNFLGPAYISIPHHLGR